MRKVYFEQGSEDWLSWRKGRLTATDAPMLMGVSPYVSAYKGWQRKVGLASEQKRTPAMERGNRDEPIARDLFISEFGINMTPCCVESDNYNFMGASLDGISDCGRYILEIKSQYSIELQTRGIRIDHMYQMQHQMLCGDGTIEKCFYVSHWDGKNLTYEVLPDPNWIEKYLPEAKKYWKGVVFHEAPPMSSKDYRDMNQDETWVSLAQSYRSIDEQIKQLTEQKDSMKERIIELCGDDSCHGMGIKVMRKLVKGRVDYESIPEIASLDLEHYRKAPSASWTIMIDKK